MKELKEYPVVNSENYLRHAWNPVKELKGSHSTRATKTTMDEVESGEGIEKEDLPVQTDEPRNPDSLT